MEVEKNLNSENESEEIETEKKRDTRGGESRGNKQRRKAKGKKRKKNQKIETGNGENEKEPKYKMRAAKIRLIERFDREFEALEQEPERRTKRRRGRRPRGGRARGTIKGRKRKQRASEAKRGEAASHATRRNLTILETDANSNKSKMRKEAMSEDDGAENGKNEAGSGEEVEVVGDPKTSVKIETNLDLETEKTRAEESDPRRENLLSLVKELEKKTLLGKRGWEGPSSRRLSKRDDPIPQHIIEDKVKKQMIYLDRMVQRRYLEDQQPALASPQQISRQPVATDIAIDVEEEAQKSADQSGHGEHRVKYAKMQTRPKKMDLFQRSRDAEGADDEATRTRSRRRRSRRSRGEGPRWAPRRANELDPRIRRFLARNMKVS